MNNRTKAIVIALLFAAVLAVPAVTMHLKSITDSPASSNRKIPRLMIIADDHDIETKGWIWTKFSDAGFDYEVVHYEDIYDSVADDTFDSSAYDALFLPGGGCVTPSVYGEERDEATYDTNLRFDNVEIGLVRRFAREAKPVLGWCRGCQIINVAFGGTLHQNIGDGHEEGKYRYVRTSEDSFMYPLYGENYRFKHFHIQAVKELGEGLKATQWDAEDGHIEGIEHESLPIYGIQYWGLMNKCQSRFYEITKEYMKH